jgi:hypothetical protein
LSRTPNGGTRSVETLNGYAAPRIESRAHLSMQEGLFVSYAPSGFFERVVQLLRSPRVVGPRGALAQRDLACRVTQVE